MYFPLIASFQNKIRMWNFLTLVFYNIQQQQQHVSTTQVQAEQGAGNNRTRTNRKARMPIHTDED